MRDFKFFTENRQPTGDTPDEILEETSISEVVESPNPAASDNPIDAIPENRFPLTNRLDKMTPDQAHWAIENGDAWIAYLQEQRADGQEVSLIEYGNQQPVQSGTVSDADAYKAICGVVDKVWNGLTDNMKRKTLRNNQIPEWVEILQWAIKVLPVGYERQREIIETELKTYQAQLTKPKRKRKDKK